jgi:hypothetical protein
MTPRALLLAAAACAAAPQAAAHAQSVTQAQFVNGIAISGAATDLSSGSAFDRRLGFFSDLYYDAGRNEWWGLSDRGPGGGVLPYETRVQRFTLSVDAATGRIGDFQVLETIKFQRAGTPLNGLAPSPPTALGNAFDPEGLVVNPANGHLLVSDEYGPSLVEFDRQGREVRRLDAPANLVPRNAGTGVPDFATDGNTAGRRSNRGFEGLAVSPDGRHAYAVLQSAMADEGGGNGLYARIVKYDLASGQAVGQYLYRLDTAAQGRGVSALVALGNDRFLVLERNNRGVGVGATLANADKAVYEIDLAGATDVSGVVVADGSTLPPGVVAVAKGAKVMDLEPTPSPLGDRSPEKWEGLAVGPRLADGRYVVLAGTDNDYSVTQNGAGTQFDVWFDFTQADPYAASIQCPLGQTTGCVATTGGAPRDLTAAYTLLPGVLHAYTARVDGYVAPAVVPEPSAVALTAFGLGLVGAREGRRRLRARR